MIKAAVTMTKSPWMSLWLSAANTWAGAARGFGMAEMSRQQKALLKEMTGSGLKGRSTTTRSSRKASTGTKRKPKR
ncbi:hypothetical protein BB934_07425 [Microvirga ossetica]|uniref:Uncharacterized protein n=1 Tax=Microvirga ossetica TaxID=1882682 RepID=A0A1B2EDN5_9HYPH|nr:hypothetical protein BB934_07425 [Microvirga ossetica]